MKLPNLAKLIQQHSTVNALKRTQVWYFQTLSSPDIDDNYIASRAKIGSVHAHIGLTATWFLGGYSVYLRQIGEKIESLGVPDGFRLYQAVSRRIIFDAAIVLEQYIGDVFKANETYRNNMDEASEALTKSIEQITTITSEFADSATSLAQSQRNVVESVNILNADGQRIEELSKFVSEVASQTNLLGLNASIEAAHAGSVGAGFNIVANEVRKLAERTKESSTDIKDSVALVLQRVNTIKDQVEHVMSVSKQQEQSAQQLEGLIQQLQSTSEKLHVRD